ncbi:hypothetical protein SASPL_157891 [Salvia splendens]|uniref:Uncharacterized protein n=1 Tax=Salvia splendens TaxID=180675 RepID=A0A8X8YVR3_SALSN|nr:hypothetical protein SASPL_157891 [Salvia splendens]
MEKHTLHTKNTTSSTVTQCSFQSRIFEIMWAIRRASNQFRNKGSPSRSGRVFRGKTEFAGCCSETSNAAIIAPHETIFDGLLPCMKYYSQSSGFQSRTGESELFSSQVDANGNGEDLEDGFSELETPQDSVEEAASVDESDDGSGSGSELSEDETERIGHTWF